jgi:capsular polysaccharide transport system permease protein
MLRGRPMRGARPKGDMDDRVNNRLIEGAAVKDRATPPEARGRLQRGLSLLTARGWLRRTDETKPAVIADRPAAGLPEAAAGGAGARPPSGLFLSFIGLVLLPSIGYLIYLLAFASDQFVATSRFAVRSAAFEQQVELPGNSATRTSNVAMPMVVGQDAYLIVAYITSHKVIEDLTPGIDLISMFRTSRADWFTRLPASSSAEDMLTYWRDRVSASVDGPSGIVTVRVRAFAPQDALTLLAGIVAASEKLANDISARARRDTVARFEDEVKRSLGNVQDSLQALREFREKAGIVDPISSATLTNTLLLQMLGEKIKLENELFVMQRISPDNATGLRVLRTNIQSVDQQVERLKAALTGASAEGRSVAAALVRYEELEMQRIFSTKMLGIAQEALTRAIQRAERQNIYLTVFVPPSLPEESRHPDRLAMSFVVPISLILLWGVLAMLAATIQDHRE